MSLVNGLLNLGTALSGSAVVTPGTGVGYSALPISYDLATSGQIALNVINAVFGPVSGSWGTLSVFGVTDLAGNPVWTGTLAAPFTPVNGQIVAVPVGSMSLGLASQVPVSPATNWLVQPPIFVSGALAGNPLSLTGNLEAIYLGSGLVLTSGAGFGTLSLVTGALVTLLSGAFVLANSPIPAFAGPFASGAFALATSAYTQIAPSAAVRHALNLQNVSASGNALVIFGPSSQPASGASGFIVLQPYGSWPPGSLSDFVSTDYIWAIASGAAVTLNSLIG